VLIDLPEFAHVRPPTRETVLALIDAVEHTPLPPDSAKTLSSAPLLAKLPTPGRIVSEKYDRVAGITEWTLSNGARVVVKPSQNDPDDLQMRAWSPGGFAMMPDSLFDTPGRMVARVVSEAGGLGGTNHDALSHQLETTGLREMKVDIGYADESMDLAGSPKDLETLFQLLYLQFTAPMLDTAALAGWQSLAKYEQEAMRPKFAYFPFGAGTRICIGEHFAWMEAMLLLSTLAQRWRVHYEGTEAPEPEPLVTLRPKGGLAARLERRA
jgi:zinc protease